MKRNKKEKEERIVKLTTKYFFQQKAWEVWWTVLGVACLIFLPMFVGSLAQTSFPSLFIDNSLWISGLSVICFILYVFILLYAAYLIIYILLNKWIESNKEKAYRRAVEEVENE